NGGVSGGVVVSARPERLIDLLAINRAIAAASDYDALLRLIVEKTASFLDADACVLLLAKGDDTAAIAASVGVLPEQARIFASALDERVGSAMCVLFGCDEERLLSAPVIEHGEIRGVLGAHRRNADRDGADSLMLSALADQAAIALAHATHRRRLQEALEAGRGSDPRKDEVPGVLSHERRNPLTPVSNSVHILRRASNGGEKSQRALAVIDRQVRHLTKLVDDLLDVTRITRGKLQLQVAEIDLTELVTRTVEDHH